jgi:hypothetical protein
VIPENTTFEFAIDLQLAGVVDYVQQGLAAGALGFYLSSNHFSGDPHNGSTIPYPQWYHKEFDAAFGGVPPTLAVDYEILDLPGDYNVDGVVDAADYSVWRNHLGSDTSLPNDDTAGVGDDDYVRWKTHFGETPDAGAGSLSALRVPEPATSLLALAGVFALVGLCRGKRNGVAGPLRSSSCWS